MARPETRWPLAIGAAFLLVAPAVALAAPADATEAPLHVLRPGAPGEPAWTMLELTVTEEDADIEIEITWIELNCPFAWGFLVFEGPAEEAYLSRSITFDYGKGYQGAEAHAVDPVELEVVAMNHTGVMQQCNVFSGWTLGFPDLPVGTTHLLAYASGTPFTAEALVTAPEGGIRVEATSHGERTYYVRGTDFESDGGYVAAHSPGFCVSPNADPSTGFCDPGYYWHGGSVGGAEAGWNRSASIEFRHHPYFVFSNSAGAGVSNATVTDPLGRVTVPLGADATVSGLQIHKGSAYLASPRSVADAVSGKYLFDLHFHADVGVKQAGLDPNWHIKAVDYFFPAEAAAMAGGSA